KPFRNSHPFHPKHLIINRNRQHELMPALSRDLLVGEEILQLDRRRHANRLKSISPLPMTEQNVSTDPVRIEPLTINYLLGQSTAPAPSELPSHLDSAKI